MAKKKKNRLDQSEQEDLEVEEEELAGALASSLDPRKERQRHEAHGERDGDDRHRRRRPGDTGHLEPLLGDPPAKGVALDEPEDERPQAEGDEEEAGHVEA